MYLNQEHAILTQAAMYAGASLSADESKRDDILAKLFVYQKQVKGVQRDEYKALKQKVLMTLQASIRYADKRKPSDAKLTRKHGMEVAKEFGRLKRKAQRQEAKDIGN